jgi:hypothetical protein
MTFPYDALDALAPRAGWCPDWNDVLVRANEQPDPRRVITKRRLILGLAALAAVLVPLTALAAANDWWFFKYPGAPLPTSAPMIVKTGEWSGHPWQLVAYPSTTDGLCFSITPTGHSDDGRGGAMTCGPFVGAPRSGATKASPDMTITYLSGSAARQLPAYIAGPVIDSAITVQIRLANGQTLNTPTFDAPPTFSHIRFYATPLPAGVTTAGHPGLGQPALPVIWLAGLDAQGRAVACLAPLTAKEGISPMSACH